MTDHATFIALADRCEQAAGPDRELNAAIDDFMLKHGPETDRIRNPRYVLPYTASLDAAVTLVPEGCGWMVMRSAAKVGRWPSRGATAALALCAAALRARAQPSSDT
jgi:hypothetical protein